MSRLKELLGIALQNKADIKSAIEEKGGTITGDMSTWGDTIRSLEVDTGSVKSVNGKLPDQLGNVEINELSDEEKERFTVFIDKSDELYSNLDSIDQKLNDFMDGLSNNTITEPDILSLFENESSD